MFRKKVKHIHFVGIGGIGMSGIAEVLITLGYDISGSDLKPSPITKRLQDLGATIFYNHKAKNIGDSQVVVFSSAVSQDNPEILEAKRKKIPVIRRAEMLAELMRMKYGIAVAGTHGKTTTTSMIAHIMAKAEMDPTMIIGGKVNAFGSNARLGQGEFLVAEADESDGTFLKLSPIIAVITNIDADHLDYYKDINDIKESFYNFADKVPFYGALVLCVDDKNVCSLIPRFKKRVISYGINNNADFMAKDISSHQMETGFRLLVYGKDMGRVELKIPGEHNIYNALASIATSYELDIPIEKIKEALEDFKGVQRRFQIKATVKDIIFVDDYGHHPAEIMATLKAAKKGWNRRVVVLFQPHRYTRTKALFNDFLKAFLDADKTIITDIYPASEKPIKGVTGKKLAESMQSKTKKDVIYLPRDKDMAKNIFPLLRQGDIFITIGAGDIYKVGEEIIKLLGDK
ncbi:MAG: UDP-N-acetylmuramate--L-alanine ligase [Deltaproteobacteria bacterium]|nr:UDP-N-acetylmuramate--L-alanine ligase [Deltaproteobacteria bacterium]